MGWLLVRTDLTVRQGRPVEASPGTPWGSGRGANQEVPVSSRKSPDANDPATAAPGSTAPAGGGAGLPEAAALAERPTDVPMRIESFAVAIAVPDHRDIDPIEYGGRTILDALSLHGITVAGVAHHDDPGPLFPKGFDGTG